MATKFRFPDDDSLDEDIKSDAALPEETDIDTDVEVVVVDDTPEEDRGRKPLDKKVEDPTEEEIESYGDKVRARIKDLTHARHDERRAKEATLREKQELERLASQLFEENKQLKQYVSTGTQQYATTLTAAAEAELENARQKYRVAQEAFDTEKIIEAQEALAAARWKLEQAKNFKAAPLQEEKTEVQTRQPTPQVVQPDQKTLSWQARNQWFGADGFEEVTSFALGLHQKLVNSGVDPRSDDYFEQIDGRVKSKFPEVFGETDTKPTGKRKSNVVASATRNTGPRKITLTATQVALAKKFNLTPQQYAEQVAKLETAR